MGIEITQFVLIALILMFAIYAFRLRTILADRLIYLTLTLIGIGLTLRPELSTWLANRVGIGRGVDLVFYTFIVFSLFHFITTASHLNAVERQMTALVRRVAINEARLADKASSDSEEDLRTRSPRP